MTMVINMTTAISGNPGIKRRKTKKEAKTNASLDALIENDGLQLYMVACNHHYNQQRFSSFFCFSPFNPFTFLGRPWFPRMDVLIILLTISLTTSQPQVHSHSQLYGHNRSHTRSYTAIAIAIVAVAIAVTVIFITSHSRCCIRSQSQSHSHSQLYSRAQSQSQSLLSVFTVM